MTLPKQEYIILNSKTQTREKWDYLVLSIADNWMIWRCHGVLFRNNVIRKQWVENDLRRCNDNFFSKVSFWKYLITAMSKVLSQQLRGTLTTAFERHLTIENFTDMDPCKCQPCTKSFDLLLYASLSLKQVLFLNLT